MALPAKSMGRPLSAAARMAPASGVRAWSAAFWARSVPAPR